MEVLLMCGPPGSGKSTYIEKLRKDGFQVVVCSADHFFMKDGKYDFNVSLLGEAHLSCFKNFMFHLETWDVEWSTTGGGPDYVVVDNTNLNMQDITPYVMLAKAFTVPFKVVKFDIDPEVCASRNVHNVPRAKVLEMAERGKKMSFPRDWVVERIAA